MTKRWERELRRLDDVDAPTERIRAHAADRPTDPSHGDGLPPRRQRITAGVVAVVVFVAAGTFAWQAFQPEGGDHGDLLDTQVSTQQVSIDLSVAERDGYTYPTASMEVGGSSIQGGVTSYGWDGAIRDTANPKFSAEDFVPITLPAEVAFVGDALDASVKLHPADDASADPFWIGDGIDIGWMHDQPLPMPSVMGRSVIEVRAKWPQGNPSFYFPVEFVDEAQSTGSQAVLAFVAKNAPDGTLSVDDEEQSGTRSEYDWCDGSGGCVNGIADFASYPPVSKFIEMPGGSLIELKGAVVSMKAQFRTMDGGRASATFEDPIVLVAPSEPGRYALETHVALDGDNGAHGSATFWFGVDVVPIAPPTASPDPPASASPAGDVSDVLRISCAGDGTQVLTPVVRAGPDGVRVELLDADISGAVARPTGLLRMEWYLQEGVSPVQLPVGEVALQCGEGTSYRSADFVPEAMATIVDPGGSFVRFALDCPIDEQVRLRTPGISPDGDRSDAPSAVEAVMKRLEGILPTDVVETAGYPEGDWSWPWVRIVRDGRIVAWAGVDGREGWSYRLNHATSCAGTEIGTPETSQDSFIGFG